MPYADPERRKQYHKQYSKTYYPANKEKYTERQKTPEHKAYLREYHKIYNQTHKEANRIKARARYLKNPEKRKADFRQWKKDNPEKYQESQSRYMEMNRDKAIARSAAWYRGNLERAKETTRKSRLRRYGLTLEAFTAIVQSQNGICPICQIELKEPAVDHDHKTGAVRGILCRKCNVAIGQLKDDPETLRRAVNYLESNLSSGATSTPNNKPLTEP